MSERLATARRGRPARPRWRRPGPTGSGLWGVLATVDHKIIGRRYVVTGMVFFFLAGVLALLMRAQLARPESGLIGPTATTRSSRCTARR
jgi:hypothetical protein